MDKDSCIYISNWFKGKRYQHLTFISRDYISFHVIGLQNGIKRNPFMLDYSMSTEGVNCNLKSTEGLENHSQVQTVIDSFYPDTIEGNDAANFISSKGNDFIQGNGGNDAYRLSSNCKGTIINNFDIHLDDDIIFIDQKFSDLTLMIEPINQSLEIHVSDFGKTVTLLKWSRSERYRHASLRTSDGVTAILPDSVSEAETPSKPIAAEISLENEDCNYGLKTYNLSQKQFQSVSRFTATSERCSYHITGNKLNNYIDPGPGNPYGYQYLEGGEGADTYVIGANYGKFNEINNYAKDLTVDFVRLSVEYNYTEANIVEDTHDIIVRSNSMRNKIDVKIKNFFLGAEYQHIAFQSADKIVFRLLEHYPYKKPMIVDYSNSKFNQILDANMLFPSASVIYGSSRKQNKIIGSLSSNKLTGGSEVDTIEGGTRGEQIEGFDGNDVLKGNIGDDIIFGGQGVDEIFGGEGNDVISGGYGADKIDGGPGMDAIVLAGDDINNAGVIVSLTEGNGQGGDASGDNYKSVEIVHGSDYDDIIEGNNENNILSGNGGQDVLTTYGGYDVLTGGLDSDVYNLTSAEGWKVINNFASDKAVDTVLLGDIATVGPCIYSYNNDFFINIRRKDSKYLNLIIKEWFTEETFRHIRLQFRDRNGRVKIRSHARRNRSETSVDKWVSFFNTNANVKIVRYDFESVTVTVDDIIKYIPRGPYKLFLNYISENQQYRKILISDRLSDGPPSFKLRTNIAPGVMVSAVVSLHKCKQVIAMSTPVSQRTPPSAPTSLTVAHVSAVSLSVSWDIPSRLTDPNSHHYRYRCTATKSNARLTEISELLTAVNAKACLFDRLQHNTTYILRVYSIIAGERSEAAEIYSTTNTICELLEEPLNGYILEAAIENGNEYAVVRCNYGYELVSESTDLSREKVGKRFMFACPSFMHFVRK